ncbi:zona pellucida sperm-binding protein 4-like [Sphaeramia orbicularis]|uniref:zona pellucida sperm-binding protein 4-like n=1 Tax=Sphaeramia orbicularis TaxID=375764 RepID=UPI00117F4E97|nr:zona pellucida sperm-binding protein 4-like [Sphaeramia orbicularis]
MVWNRVEVLVVLIWTLLLLVSGQEGWEIITEDQPEFYDDRLGLTGGDTGEPDDLGDYDDYDDIISEVKIPEFEETATGVSLDFDPSAEDDSDDFLIPPRAFSQDPEVTVNCTDDGFEITLPDGSDWKPDKEAQLQCDMKLHNEQIFIPFTGCNVTKQSDGDTDNYTLEFWYPGEKGEHQILTVLCEEIIDVEGGRGIDPRSGGKSVLDSKGLKPTPVIEPIRRLTCGNWNISPSECRKRGCCVCSSTSSCFYPVDGCTPDKQFIFRISCDSASIPVDPRKLIIPGTNCKPVIVTDKVALFKFKVTECGVHVYTVDETQIYLAEVQTLVQAWNLKYGVISRTDPLRFLIECRYSKSQDQSLVSVSYMVKTSPIDLPTTIFAKGLHGVVLRMAKDETYSSYYPTYHQPLQHLLGKPVYLELRLQSPKPYAVLLINYCIAYPRSARNALVLIYEGCTNPHDPDVSILPVNDSPNNQYIRRFKVKTFQFMDTKTNKYLNEEIYFMCSSEVCWSSEKTCQQHCFDGKSPQSRGLPPKDTLKN